MLRVSCTTLDSYRLFRDADWMAEADLLATIRGDVVQTPAMALGIAFENVLMAPEAYRVAGGYVSGDYSFADAVMGEPLSRVDRRGVFQVKTQGPYADLNVVAKADQVLGARIQEWKTTCGSFDIDKYLDAYQWRYELDLFQAASVTYHVFLLDDHGNGVVELRGTESFTVYPYPHLHEDCVELAREFSAYARLKGLDGLLEQRRRTAEAA